MRGIEFGFRRRESFPYEKMGVTQFLESGPKDVQFRLQVLRTGNSKSPGKQATEYCPFYYIRESGLKEGDEIVREGKWIARKCKSKC